MSSCFQTELHWFVSFMFSNLLCNTILCKFVSLSSNRHFSSRFMKSNTTERLNKLRNLMRNENNNLQALLVYSEDAHQV